MRSPVAELLTDLATALDGARIDWYLFGAQAAILHGAARLTADVDVTVRTSDRVSNEALVELVERHGFTRRVPDPDFTRRTRVIPFLHTVSGLPLDVVLAGPGLEDQFFSRTVHRDVEGTPVPLASAEDVIVMKLLAGRAKDFEDVAAIIRAHGDRLDTTYVELILTRLEEALGQSDLLRTFREIAARDRG
jgi:hypothetical protein